MKCPKCETVNPSDSRFCRECAAPLPSGAQAPDSFTWTLEMPVDRLAKGTLFAGRYEIIEELGAGGMGRVYRVLDTQLKEEVALKLIRPEIAAEKRTVERFHDEIKIARRISHRNVCRTHDLGQDGQTLFLTMEYVRGKDLKGLLKQAGTLTIETATAIARQVAEGLREAHRLGIVHRDLKPGNIMIEEDGQAKIMDFGIARCPETGGATAEGAMVGTPEYMSPEQAEGKPADRRSDLYALGVILFEMVTGRLPFTGDTALAIVHKHRYEPAPEPRAIDPRVPAPLSRLIGRCLEKEPDRRFQSADELLSELDQGGPPPPKPPWPAVLALVLTAGVIATALLRPIACPPPPPRIARIGGSIAVAAFENLTGDPRYDPLAQAVPSLLVTALERRGSGYVATIERLRDILKQLGRGEPGPIDAETALRACRREGIAALVTGKITRAEDIFAIDAKVLDVGSGKVLAGATSRGAGVDSILTDQIDELSGRIVEVQSGTKGPVDAPAAEAGMPTTSLEAYESYLQGQEAFGRYLFDEAERHFLKATRIDPAFAMAHLGAAHTYFQQGNTKALREAMENVMAHADRAGPKEKLYIRAWYARYVEGDIEERFRIMKEIAERYPREKDAHFWIGMTLMTKGLDEDAISAFQKVLELDPQNIGALTQVSLAYINLGDYVKAIAYAQRYITVDPKDPEPLGDLLAEIYLRTGQFDLAVESCRRALALKSDFHYALGNIVLAYGLKEEYAEAVRWADEKIRRSGTPLHKADGHLLKAFFEYWTGAYRAAREDAAAARKAGEAVQSPIAPYWSFMIEGYAHLAEGNGDPARDAFLRGCDMILRDQPASPVYRSVREYLRGSAEALEGPEGGARESLGSIGSIIAGSKDPAEKDYLDFLRDLLRARILLAEGAVDEAVPLYEGLPPYGLRGPFYTHTQAQKIAAQNLLQPEIELARGYEAKGDPGKAIGVLETSFRPDPRTKPLRLVSPKVYYALGRLYDGKGLKAKAQANYRKFLDLWTSADPGAPEVGDARKRLAGL